jgi:ABC-2 type transport system ATP-binding protein
MQAHEYSDNERVNLLMPAVEVSNLYKVYRDRPALQDVSFQIQEGEIFGIIGPNGAGKTTLVECIAGLRRPDGGQISVLGLDPQHNRQSLRKQVGVQTQASALPDKLKVWEALDLFSAFYPQPVDWQTLLDVLDLTDKRNSPIEKLSGGQRQRVSLALALIGNPRLAILDELTTGLDPHSRREVWRFIERIRADGLTMLLVTHFMEEAQHLCDRIAVIDDGQVVTIDTPDGLIARVSSVQKMRFRSSQPIMPRLLEDLSEVETVQQQGDQVIVTGTGNLIYVVTTVLAQHGIVIADVQVERATLDDAFGLLTGAEVTHDRSA